MKNGKSEKCRIWTRSPSEYPSSCFESRIVFFSEFMFQLNSFLNQFETRIVIQYLQSYLVRNFKLNSISNFLSNGNPDEKCTFFLRALQIYRQLYGPSVCQSVPLFVMLINWSLPFLSKPHPTSMPLPPRMRPRFLCDRSRSIIIFLYMIVGYKIWSRCFFRYSHLIINHIVRKRANKLTVTSYLFHLGIHWMIPVLLRHFSFGGVKWIQTN